MPRASSLTSKAAANRKKNGGGSTKLPNLPSFNGPPPGSFDPGLEAQVRAAERGLIDLIEKTHLEGRRESKDTREARQLLERKVRQGQADIARSRSYAVQDAGNQRGQLQTSFARDLQDLATAKQRGQQDYEKTLTDMQHRYAQTAAEQSQAQVASGTDDTGTTAAGAAVRGANQAYDKSGVDTVHTRHEEDIALQEQRDRENFATQSGLIDQGLNRDLTGYGIQSYRLGKEQQSQRHKLALDIARAHIDRQTQLSHAKREYGIYASDVAQQAYYQAHQMNPHILFPTPSAAAHLGTGAPHPAIAAGRPLVGVGPAHPFYPRASKPLIRTVGLRPAVSYPRRPYTRY